MDPKKMIESTDTPAAAWTDYSLNKSKYAIISFFEGEDRKYYLSRIKDYMDEKYHDGIKHISCGGRSGVIAVYEKLEKNKDKLEGLLFFVDRDYNIKSYQNHEHIYQTAEYSIENYYCTTGVIKQILEYEVGMSSCDEDYLNLTRVFEDYREKFVDYCYPINLWYLACQLLEVDVDVDIMLKHDDITVSQNQISFEKKLNIINVADYYLQKLRNQSGRGGDNSKICESIDSYSTKIDLIKQKIIDLQYRRDKHADCRGKFLVLLLKKYIQLIHDMNSKLELSRKYTSFNLKLDKNVLSTLSKYAEFPKCLKSYLKRKLTSYQ